MSRLRALSQRVRAGSIGDARVRTHEVFDELWKSGEMTRSEAYQWLCEVMNKTEEEGHIARFDIEECERLMELVKQKTIELEQGK